MKSQTETRSASQTIEHRAAEEIVAADGIHLMEEFAMSHLWDFAERLEKEYGRGLKKKGLEDVDYFRIAEQFTRSFFTRLDEKHGK